MGCSSCGAETPPEAAYCMSCGQPIKPVCSQCGSEAPPEARFCMSCGAPLGTDVEIAKPTQKASAGPTTLDDSPPTSFAKGRYRVKRFLGEGGKKKVYLAHDTTLDRDVAFSLIKTEGLDESLKISRELGMKPLLERVLSKRKILKA